MAASFSGGRSRSSRREPPTMGKHLVNFITGVTPSEPWFTSVYIVAYSRWYVVISSWGLIRNICVTNDHKYGLLVVITIRSFYRGVYLSRGPGFAPGITLVLDWFVLSNCMSIHSCHDVYWDFPFKRCSVRLYSHSFCKGFVFYLCYLCFIYVHWCSARFINEMMFVSFKSNTTVVIVE
jgi:hypothetical protein